MAVATPRKRFPLSFQVDNIDEACELISKHGGKMITIPEERPGESIMLGTFEDTEGNEIMLTKYFG